MRDKVGRWVRRRFRVHAAHAAIRAQYGLHQDSDDEQPLNMDGW